MPALLKALVKQPHSRALLEAAWVLSSKTMKRWAKDEKYVDTLRMLYAANDISRFSDALAVVGAPVSRR